MFLAEELQKKWKPVLEHGSLPNITDMHRRSVTAILLENTEKAHRESAAHAGYGILQEAGPVAANAMGLSSSDPSTGSIDTFDPVLISLVRRSAPNLMHYDVMGVQPMTGPTGLIFAMRSRYTNQTGAEAFYNEVDTTFGSVTSGANTFGQKQVGTVPVPGANLAANGVYNTGTAMSRAQAEALGTSGNTAFPQMAFSIEKISVTAGSRALKAEYTMELAQDLRAIHGLDAEGELSNILSTELIGEINREAIRSIYITAVPGAQIDTATAGVFDLDTDSNGRWMVEKFKGLMFQLEREANLIAKQTRRGKGNIIICSADVASALQATGQLSYTPALANNLQVDDTGNTFAGILNGRFKVYIDPYAIGGNYVIVGYKGSSAFDAGLFYCPYVPLQMVRAQDPDSFQPKIGFKTRYGMVANPFAGGYDNGAGAGVLLKDSNVYYRRLQVSNIL